MDWPTIIVAAIVAIIFIAIVAKGIYNRKKGILSHRRFYHRLWKKTSNFSTDTI